jgi:hypothetical protein
MMRTLLFLAIASLAVAGCGKAQPCPSPLEECGGSCLDLQSDVNACGACGHSCTAGQVCVSGACVNSEAAPCSMRSGGAFVTLGVCGQVVKIWTVSPSFVARATELAADPASPGKGVPYFDLLDGSDCDGQWTWHPDALTPLWADAGAAVCDGCPSDVEASKATYVGVGLRWCPAAAKIRVLQVDVRN